MKLSRWFFLVVVGTVEVEMAEKCADEDVSNDGLAINLGAVFVCGIRMLRRTLDADGGATSADPFDPVDDGVG